MPYIRGAVLDLGCNCGDILPWLEPGQDYVGVDSSEAIAAWWRAHRPGVEYHLRNLEVDDLDLGRRFDTVLMLAVLEHLAQPDHLLRQITQALEFNGRLVITAPSPLGDTIHHYGARLGIFSEAAAEEHKTRVAAQYLHELMPQHGLKVTLYRPFLLGGNQLCVCEVQT